MQEDKRPSLLTMLTLLAIVCGVFNIAAGVVLLIFGSTVLALIFGILSLLLGVMAFFSTALVLLDRGRGVIFLRVYAVSTASIHMIWIIAAFASGIKPSWGQIITNLLISGAILLVLFLNKDIRSYGVS